MNKEQKQLPLAVNIIMIVVFLAVIVFATVKLAPQINDIVKDNEKFRELLISYGPMSILIFIALQMLQVVVAALPGEVVQVAGGYIFGTAFGTLYSLVGILLGSVLTFYISRILGFSLVRRLLPQNSIEKFDFLINSHKSEVAMFVLFLIPGIPKDILTYIAGLTPIKPLKFFVISMVGRFPALMVSSYLGENLQKRDYTSVIIVSVIVCMLFVAGIFLKDRIINKISSMVHK